ncbi:hypothetical protein EDE11_102108 [Methylomonas methanica]|uniref:Uncharacterized protein n=1 Tax=Methylomonas methanica TaxID=421 RepID=A0ABY2CRE9_METMH|nr:hypothetical protein EDE11_102108 [Methylomonas methanica]
MATGLNLVSLSRRLILKSGLGPTAEILSLRKPSLVFTLRARLSAVQIRSRRICACPKKSIQRKDTRMPLLSCAPKLFNGVDEGGFLVACNAPHPCGAPNGLLTRYIPVPRPSGAAHANRLSCRFVRSKAPVLGAEYGSTVPELKVG